MKRQTAHPTEKKPAFDLFGAKQNKQNRGQQILRRVQAEVLFLFFILFFTTAAHAQEQGLTAAKGLLLDAPPIHNIPARSSITKSVVLEGALENADSWSKAGSWKSGILPVTPKAAFAPNSYTAINFSNQYSNNADDWLISPIITLGLASPNGRLFLEFSEKFELESGHDRGFIKASIDGGSSWITVSVRDGRSDWRETRVDITSFANKQIKLAFNLTSDESFTYTGWSISNLRFREVAADPFTAKMTSLNSQNFPFIYMNVAVDTFGVGFPDLTKSNFTVYENGVLQQDFFDVTPPEVGGGVRLADIVFVLDVTSSMTEEIEAVRQNMLSFVNALDSSSIDYRIGFVVFGDIVYTYNSGNMYSEQSTILSIINNIRLGEHGIGSGGDIPENQLDAMAAAAAMNYRPGTQKVQILLTDANAHEADGVTSRTVSSLISLLSATNMTVFPVFDTNLAAQRNQYIPIAQATNADGAYYHIYDNFNAIINKIGIIIANSYLVRYKTNNSACDGTRRNVEVRVSYEGNTAAATGFYDPCSAPLIKRTLATINLSSTAQIAGAALTIAAEITDSATPFVQSATLFYRTTGATTYVSRPMSLTSNNIYQAIIPGNAVITPGLDYYITATDGQVTSSDPSVDPAMAPYQIAILPNQPPQITHTPVTSGTPGSAIAINATVIDNTNRLVSVTLYFRAFGTLLFTTANMNSVGGNQYSATIPGNVITNAGAEYYIRAVDDFNVASTHGLHKINVGCTSNLFYDNFSDGIADGWAPNVASRWHVTNFNYCVDVLNPNGDEYTVLNQSKLADFIFDVKAKALAASNKNFFIMFGVQDFTNSPEDSYYLRFGSGNTGITLFRSVAGVGLPLASVPDNFADDNQFHNVRIERRGQNIKIYGDRRLLLSVNDGTHATGHIGFGSYQSTACFDDVQVSACPDSLPGPVVFANYHIDDDNGGASSGDNDGLPESGERVEMTMGLTNLGPRYALDVSAIISTNDPDVTILDNNNNWPNIAPTTMAGSSSNFGFQVSSTLQQTKYVTFTLTVSAANGGPWTQTFLVRVSPPPGMPELVADRVFLRTGPNSGAEVTNPVAGQQYYVHFDWRNAGALAANSFRFEIRLNNSVIYGFSSANAPGNSTHNSYGPSPVVWPAGGGVISGALDVNNVITEEAENNNKAYRTFGFQSFGDFDFTAQVRTTENFNNNGGADLCFVYGYQDERHYYYVMFNRGLNETRVYKVRDLERILVGNLGTFTIPDNNYHTVRLLRRSGDLQVYWDNTLLGGTANDHEYGAGGLGVGSFNDAGIFDDICVKQVGSTNCLFSDNFEDGNANGWLPLTFTRWDVITDGGDRGYRLHDTNYENLESLRLGEYSLIGPSTTGGQADLVAQRIFLRNSAGAEVDVPTAGQALTVNFQWQNTGSAAANNVPIEIRLNGNVLCTANVTANTGEVKTTSCATPVVFNPGSYLFEATADVGNLISESNENNNSSNRRYEVPRPCGPTACTGPALFPVSQDSTTIGDSITGRNGTTVCVDIRMKQNAIPVDAFGFHVQVNPAQLAFVNASAGDLTTGFTSVNAIESPTGSGNIICGGFGPNAIPVNSQGVLIRLCFTVTCTTGVMSDITLNNLIDDVAGMAACCNTFSCSVCLSDGDVNNSKTLSPGDALCAFNIYLNGGRLPASCDVPNFDCELIAADVNCDGVVTPSDALAIFTRYLQGGLPQHCFAKTTLAKSAGRPYRLALKQSQMILSSNASDELLKLTLRVDNPEGLRALGLQLSYPADKVEPLAVQRTALTAKWEKLDGQSLWPGQMIIGGYDPEALPNGTAAEVFEILFKVKNQFVRLEEFSLSDLVDDFEQAVVLTGEAGELAVGGTPRTFQLHQSYPNPFGAAHSGLTTIRFDLPDNDAVKMELAIYNLAGQLVRQLLTGTRAAGSYEITWDGNDEAGNPAPSGTYLYRLRAGGHLASKTLVLVR